MCVSRSAGSLRSWNATRSACRWRGVSCRDLPPRAQTASKSAVHRSPRRRDVGRRRPRQRVGIRLFPTTSCGAGTPAACLPLLRDRRTSVTGASSASSRPRTRPNGPVESRTRRGLSERPTPERKFGRGLRSGHRARLRGVVGPPRYGPTARRTWRTWPPQGSGVGPNVTPGRASARWRSGRRTRPARLRPSRKARARRSGAGLCRWSGACRGSWGT
ncbi:hypothetical protein [Streptomyces sp. NPDC051014]|uniref:hypothetical protein n=1 Tax=Streptomyces sp. NPDC051014 TaxID=3155751 RepID=UPI0033D7A7BD